MHISFSKGCTKFWWIQLIRICTVLHPHIDSILIRNNFCVLLSSPFFSCKPATFRVFACIFNQRGKPCRSLIRWLHAKPADLNLQCFQKRLNLVSTGLGFIMKLYHWTGLKSEIDIAYYSSKKNCICAYKCMGAS